MTHGQRAHPWPLSTNQRHELLFVQHTRLVRTVEEIGGERAFGRVEREDRCYQSNCNLSSIDAAIARLSLIQAASDCHSARAAKRRVL